MPISSNSSYTDITKRETKSHGSVFFPAACYAVGLPDDCISWHWHSELELILVKEGQITLSVGSRQFQLTKGSGAFVNADTLHTVSTADADKGALVYSIVFHPRLIGGAEDSIFWHKYLRPLLQNKDYSLQRLNPSTDWHSLILSKLEYAWKEIAEDAHGYEFRVRNELSEIILLLDQHQQHEHMAFQNKDMKTEQRIKQMLKYIEDHYFETITLADIAESASISKSESLRCFRQVLDTTPLRYVNQYRLIVAAQNLVETDWQVSEIGYGCGFREMGYFSAQFKKKYGMTPSEYRKK